jgi:hypothetical protein
MGNKPVENIKSYSTYMNSSDGRLKVLMEDIGFRVDEKSFVTKCNSKLKVSVTIIR